MRAIILSFILLSAVVITGCRTYELSEPYLSDFSTSGPLGEDCFQVVVKMQPEKDAETMHARRESAFIKGKKSITTEVQNQIYDFYAAAKSDQKFAETAPDTELLKKRFTAYADSGQIEQEFYLIDDSVVLLYRIYKKGIKNEILSN